MLEPSAAAQEASPRPEVIPMLDHAVTAPLRELVSLAHAAPSLGIPRAAPLRLTPPLPGPAFYGRDPISQQVGGAVLATITLLNFEGIGASGTTFPVPPDDNAAVGATQVVQQVNNQIAVFSKTTGALLLGPANTNVLFSNLGSGNL